MSGTTKKGDLKRVFYLYATKGSEARLDSVIKESFRRFVRAELENRRGRGI